MHPESIDLSRVVHIHPYDRLLVGTNIMVLQDSFLRAEFYPRMLTHVFRWESKQRKPHAFVIFDSADAALSARYDMNSQRERRLVCLLLNESTIPKLLSLAAGGITLTRPQLTVASGSSSTRQIPLSGLNITNTVPVKPRINWEVAERDRSSVIVANKPSLRDESPDDAGPSTVTESARIPSGHSRSIPLGTKRTRSRSRDSFSESDDGHPPAVHRIPRRVRYSSEESEYFGRRLTSLEKQTRSPSPQKEPPRRRTCYCTSEGQDQLAAAEHSALLQHRANEAEGRKAQQNLVDKLLRELEVERETSASLSRALEETRVELGRVREANARCETEKNQLQVDAEADLMRHGLLDAFKKLEQLANAALQRTSVSY